MLRGEKMRINEVIKYSTQQIRKRNNKPKESLGKEIMKITVNDSKIENRSKCNRIKKPSVVSLKLFL